jgi:site-specific DNA recombinase
MANNTDFVSLQESFDTTTIYGRAMVGILSIFAQMERETITERTLMGRAGRSEEGFWHGGGTEPIGYDYVDGELVINKEEARQVQAVYNLYASGFSVTDISRRMEGYKTKHGDWSHTSTVGNVLDNPLYSGIIHFDGVFAKGKHSPIVDIDVDQRVKARRARLRRVESAGDSAYLLTGVIFCKSCGARYFPHKRPNGKVVYSCHSRAKKNRKMIKDPACKAPHIPVAELDAMVEAEILRLADDLSLVDEIIKKRAAGEGSSHSGKESKEIQRLDAEINKLMDLYQIDDLVSVEEIAERLSKLHAERMKISPKVEVAGDRTYDIEGAKVILRDIRHGRRGLELRGRRVLLLQLIDQILINAGGKISIDWSFE